MSSTALYCPGPVRKRKGTLRVEPAQLVQIFEGDGYLALAAAVLLNSGTIPGVRRPSGAERAGFLRSRWYETICAGLEVNPSYWRRVLREQLAEKPSIKAG